MMKLRVFMLVSCLISGVNLAAMDDDAASAVPHRLRYDDGSGAHAAEDETALLVARAEDEGEITLERLAAKLRVIQQNQKTLSDNQGVMAGHIDAIRADMARLRQIEQQRLELARQQYAHVQQRTHPCWTISMMAASTFTITALSVVGNRAIAYYFST